MAHEKGKNKARREEKKKDRLRRLMGIDLCACGGGNKKRCEDVCRQHHINDKTGRVECGECYQIGSQEIRSGDKRKPRRTWKYGTQKNNDSKTERKRRTRDG